MTDNADRIMYKARVQRRGTKESRKVEGRKSMAIKTRWVGGFYSQVFLAFEEGIPPFKGENN